MNRFIKKFTCAEGALNSMLDDLVVIAMHGDEHIDKCLDSIGNKYPVLIVDTHSSASDVKRVQLKNNTLFNVKYHYMPYKCYMTGALMYAYENYPAKNYFLMQDSMEAMQTNFLDPFKAIQPDRGAVAWCTFDDGFDNDQQKAWAQYYYSGEYPVNGIFGSVIYVKKSSLDELADRQLLPPVARNKNQDQGNERLWAWAFKEAGMEVTSVGGKWDVGKMQSGEFPVFKKQWVGRI
jgi:hypothetical protein